MYNSSNFIGAYNSSDLVIKILDSNGNKQFGLNVCQYQKATVNNNIVWILMHDKKEYVLNFTSNVDANQAQIILENTVNALSPNCAIRNGNTGAFAVYTTTITTNGQLTIGLPSTPTQTNKFDMFLNGQMVYDYTLSGNSVTWGNTDYQLESGDIVTFKIY